MLKNPEDLKGLGGWLFLLGIGIVLSPIAMIGNLRELIAPIVLYINDGTWEALTSASSEYYNPILVTLIVEEIFFNGCFTLAFVYIAYLFFSKHYLFPKYYIMVQSAFLIYMCIHLSLVYYFLDKEFFDKETQMTVFQAFLAYCIWVAYVVKSKRVNLTFVEKRSKKPETVVTPYDQLVSA